MNDASFQMLPDVTLLTPFTGPDAQALVSLCPKKVFDIEDMGNKAVVARALDCSLCRCGAGAEGDACVRDKKEVVACDAWF